MKNIDLQQLNKVRRDAIEKSRGREISNRTFDMIRLMCMAARIMRKEGVLSGHIYIPEDMAFCDDVRTAFELVMDGDRYKLTKVLTDRYWEEKLQGEDALIYYILILSSFKIASRVSPISLREILFSCLTDNAAEQYSEYADSFLQTDRTEEDISSQMLEEVRADALEKSKKAEIPEYALDMIYLMCNSLRTVREKGILSLEYYIIPGYVPFKYDIKIAFDLIVSAASQGELTEILTNRYWVKNLQDGNALIYYLLILSALNIMCGTDPAKLEKQLLSYLSDKMNERYREYAEEEAKHREELILGSLPDEAVERRYNYLKRIEQNCMTVKIYSREKAEKLIVENKFPENAAVISFCDSDFAPVQYEKVCKDVHIITIDDLAYDELKEYGYTFDTFLTSEETNAAAEFIYKAYERGQDIICQCEYGQSRSAGCAAAVLEHFFGTGISVFTGYEEYYPNKLVYNKIVDALERYKKGMKKEELL